MKIFKNTYSEKDNYCGIAVDDCDYVLRNEDESIKITAVKSTMMYAAVEEVFKLFKNNITNIRLKTAYIRVLRHKRGKHYLSTIFYWNEDIPSQEDLFGVFSIYDFNNYAFDSEEKRGDEFYRNELKEMIKDIVERIANYSHKIYKRENEITLDDNIYTLSAEDALKECKALGWSLDMIRDSYYHYTLKGDR